MKTLPAIIVYLLILSGCSSPGSLAWHNKRMKEIEDFYLDGKISDFEYLYLKNNVDYVRATRLGDSPIIIEHQELPQADNFLPEITGD